MTTEVAMLAVGLAVGSVAVWLILKGRIQAAADKAKAEAEAQCAGLSATLQARDAQLQGVIASFEKATGETARLQTNLTSESARRAAAEEKNTRIPILEDEVKAKGQDLAALNTEVAKLREAQVELNTLLQKERQAADEKLALLNDAQRRLGDAFKALSSDALKSNNQTFLDLAKTVLEAFQQSARTDLTARQRAIDDLVKPLKESLEKVDGKIAVIEMERRSAYSTLTEQVRSLATTQAQLHTETANLVKALRAPQVRGRWGEIQLQRVVENAQVISNLGRELYERMRVLAEHFATVGSRLDGAVDAYNKAAGSLESRVLVTARKFKELGAASDREIETVEGIEKTTRAMQATELTALPAPPPKPWI